MSEIDFGALAPLAGEGDRAGRLRAAMNHGNRALVQATPAGLIGVMPALALHLADGLGVPLETADYHGAREIVESAGEDVWDVAFLAIDRSRETHIAYTRPYVVIEIAYAVRAGEAAEPEALDRDGATILAARGTAYDLHLTKTLTAAEILRDTTPADTFRRFVAGEGDAVAGVRQSLEEALGATPGIVIQTAPVLSAEQAMVLPRARAALLPALDAYVAAVKADGTVRRALEASGQGGLRIPD
ncbi:MAG: transporter substrate-binding domain-containing protein [Pseudomonadota bacterium]